MGIEPNIFVSISNDETIDYFSSFILTYVRRAVARILLLGGRNGSLGGQVLKIFKF